MAEALQIRPGTKMHLAFDVPVNEDPKFNMVSTFKKALDTSAFLVSIPMAEGKPMEADDTKKLLFRYQEGEEQHLVAGYVDDVVKEGIRRYWKVRRVAEHREFIKRVDVRMKVELPLEYMQDTWVLNNDGEIEKAKGMTMDISNNGLAVYGNLWLEVGESVIFTLPRIGTAAEGQPARDVVGVVCWVREMPKGGPFKFVTGVQLRFSDTEERKNMQDYVSYVKNRYKL